MKQAFDVKIILNQNDFGSKFKPKFRPKHGLGLGLGLNIQICKNLSLGLGLDLKNGLGLSLGLKIRTRKNAVKMKVQPNERKMTTKILSVALAAPTLPNIYKSASLKIPR